MLIVAVDSGIDLATLPRAAARATEWERTPPPLSEGAAAVLLAAPPGPWGRLALALEGVAPARDDGEAPVDGDAMTALLRAALASGSASLPVVQTYGPHNVDELRQLTWNYAAARCFDEGIWAGCELICVEDDIGRLGAAAGAAHLVYGAARGRLIGFADLGDAPSSTFVSWAISVDGALGLSLVEASHV